MNTLNTIIEEEKFEEKIDTICKQADQYQINAGYPVDVPVKTIILSLFTTAMQRAYEAGKADSAHENTPDIEWEKKIREKLSVAGSDGFAIDADIDGVIEIVTQTLTSRDTYWKERNQVFVNNIIEDIENMKGVYSANDAIAKVLDIIKSR